MTAPRSILTTQARQKWKPKAASRIGASSFRAAKSAGPIWCAGRSRSTPRPCPIRCWCARTAPFSTPCRRWPMISTSPSAMWCAAKTMSPTPRPQIEIFAGAGRDRCRTSPIFRCWWAPAARRCPSGWARCRCESLREDGIEPLAVASYLAKIGTSDADRAAPVLGRAGAGIRLRQDRPGAGAFRCRKNLWR